jgi:hypothetical protein
VLAPENRHVAIASPEQFATRAAALIFMHVIGSTEGVHRGHSAALLRYGAMAMRMRMPIHAS